MLLLSFVSMGQTVMASVIPKWCMDERIISLKVKEAKPRTALIS